MNISKELGLSPKLRTLLASIADAMSGDLAFSVSPATVDRSATSAAWTRTVEIALVNSAGQVHEWFTKDIANGVSIADDSTAGTASIASTTLSFVNGRAAVVVSGDAEDWLEGETNTLTIEQATIMGYIVAEATSVETIIA